MGVDTRKLESHLGKVGGRSRYVPHDAAIALGAFVCPRADGYGAREGVIPPGVAAENGLIPAGLRKVSTDAALHSARQDDENPKTAQEQYREYYGRGADQLSRRNRQEPPQVHPEDLTPTAGGGEAGPDDDVPAAPARPARPAKSVKSVKTAAKQDKGRKRVFSKKKDASSDDDTLDGFYAGLTEGGGLTPSQAEQWPDASFSGDDGVGRGEPEAVRGVVPPPPAPRAHGAPPVDDPRVARLEEELAEQRKMAEGWYAEAERRKLDLDRHKALLSHQNNELKRISKEASEARTSHDDGPIRVYLGAEDVKLKVAGPGWDCNVMGHLCYSRGKSEVTLVVMDPGYGSDLLGSVQEGACVIVSSEGRTACQYHGHCDKIYGDTDSSDFITVMRFSCDPTRALA